MNLQYEEVVPTSKDQALTAFAGNDTAGIVHAMLGAAYHEPDWQWVQDWCLHFLESSDPDIRGTAITCLGHLARIHQKIQKTKVVSALQAHAKDPAVAGRIEDAIQDIEMFVK